MTLEQRTQAILDRIDYLNYALMAITTVRGETMILAQYYDPDIYTGTPVMQATRRWLISPHMTDSEIVQTAFKLCFTSMEHRCREAFQYKGARVFGAHFDVEDLVTLCQSGKEDAGAREPQIEQQEA